MRKPKDVMQNEFIKNSLSDEDNLIYEKAMDVMCRSIAIGFTEWKDENYYKWGTDCYYAWADEGVGLTLNQLYEIYINQN